MNVRFRHSSLLLASAIILAGCNDMYDNSRIKPLEENSFFPNKSSARTLPAGTVARGHAVIDDLMHTGRVNGKLSDTFPFAITDSVMRKGRERFTTFCTPCHGRLGEGDGMIVQRGFPRP
ncbi:MAG: cytochrome c, partial [bacterium]